MHFSKWHGIGNDFLLVLEDDLGEARGAGSAFVADWPEDRRPRLEDDAVVAVCDRHFGVGADGILVLGPSETADARMLIHNADGSMAEMCGNGIRVAARFLAERGIVTPDADGRFAIETSGGTMRPQLLPDGRVRVDMGELTGEGMATIEVAGESLTGAVVHVGNPHFAVHREPEGPDLHRLGPVAEVDPRFPNRTNVEFWTQADTAPDTVRMRVWERGVGETLACGTGACAVAFAARDELGLEGTVTVQLPGGDLEIELDGDRAFMTGAAHEAWSGELDLAQLVAGAPRVPLVR
ncbi:MAG: DapF [Thermoleophilia bacterium]|nr:DapF [Thermoleophilia bacterium]